MAPREAVVFVSDLIDERYSTTPEFENKLKELSSYFRFGFTSHGKDLSIFQHPVREGTNAISLRNVSILGPTHLKFSIGIFTNGESDFHSDGAAFQITAEEPGKENIVFRQEVTEFDVWRSFTVDLSEYERPTLRFETEPLGNNAFDWAFWGAPRLVPALEPKRRIEFDETPEVFRLKARGLGRGAVRLVRGWLFDSTTELVLPETKTRGILEIQIQVIDRQQTEKKELVVETWGARGEPLSSSKFTVDRTAQVFSHRTHRDPEEARGERIRIHVSEDDESIYLLNAPNSLIPRKKASDRPNVFLISIDTWRADHFPGCAERPQLTPNLSRLAADGFSFARAYSHSPWTLPSHTSLFTSLTPSEHRVVLHSDKEGHFAPYIGPHHYLPENFQDFGYATLALTGGGFVHSRYGFELGFDHYFENVPELSEQVVDGALERIREYADFPLFAFLHTYELHDYFGEKPAHTRFVESSFDKRGIRMADYLALLATDTIKAPRFGEIVHHLMPPAGVRYLHELYDGALAHVDELLGRFFTELKKMNLYESAWIIVTSDHGEGFGELHSDGAQMSWHHGSTLYEELLHVPLLVKPPREWAPRADARVIQDPVQLLDVAPTLLSLAAAPREPQFQGRDLSPLLRDRSLSSSFIFAEEISGQRFAVIRGGLKLIVRPRGRTIRDREELLYELYDLERDPREEKNLVRHTGAERYEKPYFRLKRALEEHAGDLLEGAVPLLENEADGVDPTEGLPDEELERLRALGYL